MGDLDHREVYCPAHFGNSYEAMWPREMAEVLAEARHWGFNAYSDWLDSADLKSPWAGGGEYLLPQALWERKLLAFRAASDLGLRVNLVMTPNHVFLDQLAPELLADTTPQRIFGQLLCPSKPRARQVILANYEHIFRDLKEQGTRLDSICACPYDYGGCACPACDPWIVTFGRLVAEIHDLARRYFPGIRARLVGWWWTAEEHRAFAEWADAHERGRFVSLAAHIRYGETAPDLSAPVPDGCARHAFVHIGYGDRGKPDDVYGLWGPAVAPRRVPETVKNLQAADAEGFMAYSEGVFDDVNKALLAGLASGAYGGAGEVLEAYAERYFGAEGRERTAWADWMAQWGSPYEVDTRVARAEFERLVRGARPGWRLDQLACKLRLFELHAAVSRAGEWTDDRLAAAEAFFAQREHMMRGVWGLGPVRHVLAERFHQPDWHDAWRGHIAGARPPAEHLDADA